MENVVDLKATVISNIISVPVNFEALTAIFTAGRAFQVIRGLPEGARLSGVIVDHWRDQVQFVFETTGPVESNGVGIIVKRIDRPDEGRQSEGTDGD